ncbi:MAG: hypothetical protein OHK93_002860 [Ramalina farinacea]|uniref:Uncharacterized protein n=1 Tax=Ramalina farinacea TaxID=258253 RepID=A0AA43QUU5_9LECA|nr:hypothetical protein [Ramalina farinacea]
MHIHRFSSILILLLTTLPTSLIAAPNKEWVQCEKNPKGVRSMAPFPSHCRTLAEIIRNKQFASMPMIFDGRSDWPGLPHIPVPYETSYETCFVRFEPNELDPSSKPGSNFAAYRFFAAAMQSMIEICFNVHPGQESKDYIYTYAISDADVVPLGTGKWQGSMTGPGLNPAGSANVTAEGGGFNDTVIVGSWANGPAEQGRVDVT